MLPMSFVVERNVFISKTSYKYITKQNNPSVNGSDNNKKIGQLSAKHLANKSNASPHPGGLNTCRRSYNRDIGLRERYHAR